jgi:hypothetical protein
MKMKMKKKKMNEILNFKNFLTESRYNGEGVLEYGPDIRIVVWIDRNLADYYRSLIPKYKYVQPQKYPPHITVVRTGKEQPTNMTVWNKYQGQSIPFTYDNEVHTDGKYFYLNAWSDRIGEIRQELGLSKFRFSDEGINDHRSGNYHITIGNVK